jgi:hypothetical protein
MRQPSGRSHVLLTPSCWVSERGWNARRRHPGPRLARIWGSIRYKKLLPSRLTGEHRFEPKFLKHEGTMSAITRRTLTVCAAASAAMTASGWALAQPAPAARVKGPAVWLDMDQKELDDAYDRGSMRRICSRC